MLNRLCKAWLIPIILFVLAAATAGLIRQRTPMQSGDESMIFRMSGAARVFVMDAVWMRMSTHQQEGLESLVLSDARTLLALDPDSPAIRSFLFQHLAMTMARKAAFEPEKQEWIREGFQVMKEGLDRDPASSELCRALGMAFFVRTENPDPAFTQVCMEAFDNPPVRIAHKWLEKALTACNDGNTPDNVNTLDDVNTSDDVGMRDDVNIRLFRVVSLWNAARFEMHEKQFSQAATLWERANQDLWLWLEFMENPESHGELEAYYSDVQAYCTLMADSKKVEEIKADHVKTLEVMKKRIKANRFCDLGDELEP